MRYHGRMAAHPQRNGRITWNGRNFVQSAASGAGYDGSNRTHRRTSMTIWGVIPSIRVQDMPAAFAFYTETLGFEATRGTPEDVNVALHRGDARLMIEAPTDFYSPEYNEAIRERLGN